MELRVLGPVTLWDGDTEIAIAPRLRALLSVLLCHRGQVASIDVLVEALWGERSPAAAPRSLQVYVHRLRAALGGAHRIEHRPPGYRLVVAADRLDSAAFEHLVGQARARLAEGQTAAGADLLRRALDLWHGAAFDGCDDIIGVREEADRLTELRHEATEECLRARLDLGRHADAVGELRVLVAAHPYREGLRGLLMLALYRLGRASEALDSYREARALLADELGLEPGPELRALEHAILNQDPALDAPVRPAAAPVPTPRELPADVTAFTGRGSRADSLAALLTAAPAACGAPAGPPIAAIGGGAGVGKSALAIRVAHRVAGAYPDGQLYVNLHGHTAGTDPLTPGDVLDRFLRALGDATPHTDTEEAAARFRSLTADRRVLVVLDNAADEAQVRELLPAGPGCGVLITGRRVLAGLDGAVHEHLDALPPSDAAALLGRLIGAERATAEADAAAEIARLCGNWPLALRIAAARLVVHPGLALAAFAGRLAEDRGRLDELQHADLAVRASLAASHRHSPEEARTLAHLGVFNGHTISVPVAAAAAGTSDAAAARDLDALMESQFLQSAGPDRYEMHDLVRAYAREQAETLLTPKEYDAVLERVLHHYLATARHGCVAIEPAMTVRTEYGPETAEPGLDLPDKAAAVAWFDAEMDNLVVAVRRAAASDRYAGIAVGIGAVMTLPLEMRCARRTQKLIGELMLAAAERAGDPRYEAQAHLDLGLLYTRLLDQENAYLHANGAVAASRAIGDRNSEALGLNVLGMAYMCFDENERAVAAYTGAVALCSAIGSSERQVFFLGNLGNAYRRLGRYDDALAACQEAMRMSRELGLRRLEANSYGQVAAVLRSTGRTEEAATAYRQALERARSGGFQFLVAECLWMLGELAYGRGEADTARGQWSESAEVLRAAGSIDAEEYREIMSAPVPDRPAVLEPFG
ncbi:MAG TPA: BTAD domain-containing putative transcriptional regulator [Streptosporangiaceae bacterium]|jgi:DNA-binding SARP family transcriptional activator